MFTAVIVEPRLHKALELVLLNFNKNLDEQWSFLIYHGNNNKEFISSIIEKNKIKEKREVRLVSTHKDNLTIDEYNLLFYSLDFYKNITTDMFLVFQTDTLISDKHSANIYNYLEYDYVGAPWKNKKTEYEAIGNGGFSLRKKSKMLELIKNGGYISPDGGVHYEDRFFSDTCGNRNTIHLNKPSFEMAKKFSVETIFNSDSVGIHKPWAHLTPIHINVLKHTFFDIEKLIELQDVFNINHLPMGGK
jgi:hypothetical protein